ncbi:MAG: glycosyltransferase [Niabella sp.]|nr:glycosyltransferase [Niabella sp.]
MPFLNPGNIIFIALLAVTAILLFYYLYFFARLAFYRDKDSAAGKDEPVSIIVCGKNEADNFAQNVPALLQQHSQAAYQVLIVNDQSTDDTASVLAALKNDHPALTLLNLSENPTGMPGKKYPLSAGINNAAHELLLLTDADCAPASERWLEHMTRPYKNGAEVVLGYGAYRQYPGFLNKVIRYETFHSALQYLSYALAGVPYMGVGRNLSYKKDLFLKNNGFADISHLPGGDDDLFINKVATSKNTAIVTTPEAHTLSEPKRTWAEWKNQKTRHFSTSKYYKFNHKILLGLYSLSHFLFYILIAAAFVCNWQSALLVFAAKSLFQQLIFGRVMKKLNEPDLGKWTLIMDLWMVVYYLLFAPMLFKKEKKSWN